MATDQPPGEDGEDAGECLKERYWSYFLACALITFFAGLIIILSFRLSVHFCQCKRKRPSAQAPAVVHQPSGSAPMGQNAVVVKVDIMTRLKWQCESLISGQTVVGRIMVRYPYIESYKEL